MKKYALYLLTGHENVLAAQRLRMQEVKSLPEVLEFISAEAAKAYQSGMERACALLGKEDEIWFMPEPMALKLLGREAQAEPEVPEESVQVTVVFGEAGARDMAEGIISEDVIQGLNRYCFATQAEADAFIRGIDEAAGWLDYYLPDDEDFTKVETVKTRLQADKVRAKELKAAGAPFDRATLNEFVLSYGRGGLDEAGFVEGEKMFGQDYDYAQIASRLLDLDYTVDEEDEEEVEA